MSRAFIVTLALAGLGSVAALPALSQPQAFLASETTASFVTEFSKFKQDFGKVYQSAEHEAARFVHFVNNLQFIRTFKSDSIKLAVNQYADMSTAEFKAFYLGYKASPRVQMKILMSTAANVVDAAPDSIDWVAKGAVTPVKNQGQCGSCWAFSTTGAVEGAIFVKDGVLESLSEQELVSCDTVDSGCQGGSMDNGFTFAKTNGLPLESDYPYTSGAGSAGTCVKGKTTAEHSKVTDFTDVAPNSETALKNAVATQPVSVAIEADQQVFQFYSSGVIKATDGCGTNLDHGVLLVGYGTETDGTKYWKVKNSWGSTWGDAGYVKLERTDSTSGSGTCGIAMDASYPTVA